MESEVRSGRDGSNDQRQSDQLYVLCGSWLLLRDLLLDHFLELKQVGVWVGLGIAFFLQSLQQLILLLVLQTIGTFWFRLVLLFLFVVLQLKLLRRLSKDVLVHLLHDLLRNLLQLAI